ncbi:unnamed protein product [Parascedosporium putredinis]|uniref:Uncharacterized protein n=1 Tax=Parascedosporium putredinis TaxID=1442378 RepID=A0A9P1GWN1_9PEZI|nr:unnamed protein product [Parascedosporium putredinis]CAI7989015.1 unnamed protein product [Parascedosporium putredinis]
MGIYKGREDFNKPIVRQLQEDVDDLTDAQLIAVARGLPLPEPDVPFPADLLVEPQSTGSLQAAKAPALSQYFRPPIAHFAFAEVSRKGNRGSTHECFVQIKRPDPHVPESHGEPGAEANPNDQARETHNMLVSEPAACPYCTQPEFGVTYEAPPFRRGLVYPPMGPIFGASAMSSQTSLHSNPTPASPTSPTGGRRRGQSLSATAHNVVTTDRIRPDWALKLASQRTTQARRAAAATALHQAAFIMYNNDRQFTLGARAPRFMRRSTNAGQGQSPSPSATPSTNPPHTAEAPSQPTTRHYMTENDRLQQFEEVMMAEAIRLSLAAEEERRRKAEKEAEKEAKKEAKKREKDERKNAKLQAKGGSLYADGQGSSSRSNKGKAIERSGPSQPTPSSSIAIPPQTGHHGPSHLRQTSNISSLCSSLVDSPPGSYQNQDSYLGRSQDGFNPGASGASFPDGGAGGPESMFNFTSMASRMGINLDGPSTRAGEDATATGASQSPNDANQAGEEELDSQQTALASQLEGDNIESSVLTLQPARRSSISEEGH